MAYGGSPVATEATGQKSAPAANSVTTTAEKIVDAGDRKACIIQPLGADLYLGADNTVDDTLGVKVAAGEMFTDTVSSDAWWAYSDGTADVRIIVIT